MENWDNYRHFLAVVDCGSLLGAAKKLKTTHSTVLRRIKSLEERLQTRLFDHLPQGYVLTSNGQNILQNIKNLENQIRQAEIAIAGSDKNLSGSIKISTSDTLGYYFLPQYIKIFKKEYPNIILDIDITNQLSSLTKREADIIITPNNRHPDTMIGSILRPIYFGLYAHKDYIKKHGKPNNKNLFSDFHFLIGNKKLANTPSFLFLKNQINEENIAVRCDKFSGLYQFCRNKMGVAPLPHYIGDCDCNLTKIINIPKNSKAILYGY